MINPEIGWKPHKFFKVTDSPSQIDLKAWMPFWCFVCWKRTPCIDMFPCVDTFSAFWKSNTREQKTDIWRTPVNCIIKIKGEISALSLDHLYTIQSRCLLADWGCDQWWQRTTFCGLRGRLPNISEFPRSNFQAVKSERLGLDLQAHIPDKIVRIFQDFLIENTAKYFVAFSA